ncbi:MAG TPA: hypothetical protein VN903_18290 [Polyangia bacterium]|jgi:hypothetical protein|nr:hypothetical protein [Polyangia bacterium]
MFSVRRHVFRLAMVAAAIAGCTAEEGSGLKVTIDLAGFKPATMKVAISADHGGFVFQMGDNPNGIGVTTEDLDGDGALELIATFAQPDPTVTFRVKADSQIGLTMTVKAMAFDADDMIASADGAAPTLPPGGHSAISLRLAMATPGPIGANTRTTDLGTAAIDVAVWGRQTDVNMSSLAVCDVDDDGNQDIIIGAPGDDGLGVGATGAVYIVWGGWSNEATVDLAPQNPPATIFYGTSTGARLGASVACVDLNGDGAGDIIASAPGANLGQGRIYAVFGRMNFRANRPIDLSSTTTTGAEIVWTTKTASAQLGSVLHAVTPSPGRAPFILAAAPGAQVTHLFSDVTPSTSVASRQIDADAADHPTFTGIAAAALAAGDLDGQAANGQPLQIAIGDPDYRLPSDTAMRRGKVYLFAAVAPNGTAPIDAASASPTITGKDKNSRLGTSLLIADTSGNGEDLFAGAPGDDTNGVVYVFKHSTGLLLPPELSTTDTDNVVPIMGYENGGLFGSALASTRAGSANGFALRLVVGAPNVSRGSGRVAIGAAYLYKADTQRRFRIYEQVYGKDAGDALGSSVAGGQLNAGAIGDLVAAAPNARGSDAATGVVYVRYGQ